MPDPSDPNSPTPVSTSHGEGLLPGLTPLEVSRAGNPKVGRLGGKSRRSTLVSHVPGSSTRCLDLSLRTWGVGMDVRRVVVFTGSLERPRGGVEWTGG